MKIFKMLLFGVFGIAAAAMGFFTMILISDYVFGLVVSLLGSLAGAQAVLGYIGKEKPEIKDYKKIVWIGAVFGLLAAILSYALLIGFGDPGAIIFIAISALGGQQVARAIFLYKSTKDDVASSKRTVSKSINQKISFGLRMNIATPKLIAFVIHKLSFVVFILFLGFILGNGLGIAWVLFVIFFIYDLWRSKILVVTDKDLNPPPEPLLKRINQCLNAKPARK